MSILGRGQKMPQVSGNPADTKFESLCWHSQEHEPKSETPYIRKRSRYFKPSCGLPAPGPSPKSRNMVGSDPVTIGCSRENRKQLGRRALNPELAALPESRSDPGLTHYTMQIELCKQLQTHVMKANRKPCIVSFLICRRYPTPYIPYRPLPT